MNVELTGTIVEFGEVYERESFIKRDMIIETSEQFKNVYAIEFVKDRMSILDKFLVGDVVTVQCNLRGRQWTTREGEKKYFLTLQGWSAKNG